MKRVLAWTLCLIAVASLVAGLIAYMTPGEIGVIPLELRDNGEPKVVTVTMDPDTFFELENIAKNERNNVWAAGRLHKIWEDGKAFSVPTGTRVRIMQKQERILRVKILDGPMKDRIVWMYKDFFKAEHR